MTESATEAHDVRRRLERIGDYLLIIILLLFTILGVLMVGLLG